MVSVGDKIRLFRAGRGTISLTIDKVVISSGFAQSVWLDKKSKEKQLFTRVTEKTWKDSKGRIWDVLGPEVPTIYI